MRRAIVLNEADNVATALAELQPGEVVEVQVGSNVLAIRLVDPVPFGHKFSIVAIPCGEKVVKYGEVIGRATRSISVGEHVHVHNVESERGRGDRAAAMR